MKTVSKKILAVLLAVLMVISMVPAMAFSIFAEGEAAQNEGGESLTPADQSTGIFVSNKGSDETGDGTLANPYATLAKAVGTITADGKTVYIMDNITATAQTEVKYNVKITSCDAAGNTGASVNHTITRASGITVLKMNTMYKLVTLENITFDYKEDAASAGTYLAVNNGKADIKAGTVFKNNKTTGAGGALDIGASKANTSECDLTVQIFEGAVFLNNSANGNGGAINKNPSNKDAQNNDKQKLYVYGGLFEGNYSGGNGGAIHEERKPTMTLQNAIFKNNTAVGGGGAVNFGNRYMDKDLTVSDCVFIGNKAANAGALNYNRQFNFTVNNCVFINNIATDKGGAILTEDTLNKGKTTYIKGSVFTGNTADKGGAIYVGDSSSNMKIEISNSFICGNTATTSSGAVYCSKTRTVKGSSVITANTAAGAESNFSHTPTLSSFTGYISGVTEGELTVYGALVMLENEDKLGWITYENTPEGIAQAKTEIEALRESAPIKSGYVATTNAYESKLGVDSLVVIDVTYIKSNYTVNYVDENGNLIEKVLYDADDVKNSKAPDTSSLPTKNGYNVIWADYEVTSVEFDVKPTYIPIKYTVTFMLEGVQFGDVQYFTVEDYENVTPPSLDELNETSEEFWYWPEFTLEGKYDNVTVEAVAGVSDTVVTVTFIVGEEQIVVKHARGVALEPASIPTPLAKDGYAAVWPEYSLNVSVVVEPVYTPITYKVTFKDNDGDHVVEFNIENMTIKVPSIAAKEGFEFSRWTGYAPGTTEITLAAVGDIEIEAIYKTWTLISNKSQLEAFRNEALADPYSYGKLVNDIDFAGSAVQIGKNVKGCNYGSWSSLSLNGAPAFSGIFDGQGYTISNYKYSNKEYCGAMFPYVKNGTIKNLTINGVIESSGSASFIGIADGSTLYNCAFNGVVSLRNEGYSIGGGLIAEIKGGTNTIERCYVTGALVTSYSGHGYIRLGGLVGEKDSGSLHVINCFVAATIGEVGGSQVTSNAKTGTVIANGGYNTLTNFYYTEKATKIFNTSGGVSNNGNYVDFSEYFNGSLVAKMNEAAGEEIWAMETTTISLAYRTYRSGSFANPYVTAVVPTWKGSGDAAVTDVAIKGATLELNGAINMLFFVPKADVADGATVTLTVSAAGNTVTLEPVNDVSGYSAYYVFRYTGLAAKQMGVDVRAVVNVTTAEGTAVGTVLDYGVLDYSANMLAKGTTTDNMKSLIVAMLDYGAAAQTYFNYNKNALANAGLTDEQKALDDAAENSASTIVSKQEIFGEGYDAISGANLILDGTVSINFLLNPEFSAPEGTVASALLVFDAPVDNYTYVEAATNGKIITVSGKVTEGDVTYTSYTLSDIYAADLGTQYYAVMYYKDANNVETYSKVLSYSVYDYAVSKKSDENANLAALANAILAYGEASRTFFGIE